MTLSRRISLLAVSVALLLGVGAKSAAAKEEQGNADSVARPKTTFAVVIGNNRSLGQRRPDLHYADDDAARYFEILQTMAPGRVSLLSDFDRDTQRLFPSVEPHASKPKRSTLLGVGQRLAAQVRAAQKAGQETEVYFVFAGHGDVAQGEGFIELADGRFTSSDLKAWLGAIPFTRAHVILDSCNSFFMLGVRKPGGRHFATSEDAARALAERLPNVGVFLSTSAEGEAFEWSEIQSGIFSHVVRSGLMGAADANADGTVSYLELAAFVDTATAGVRNPNMRPHVFARGPGAADGTAIAHLQSMDGVRRFQLSASGALRLRLRDANGLPLLDAHAENALTLQVAVPETWAQGAMVERSQGGVGPRRAQLQPQLYAVPEGPGTVTLAALQDLNPRSAMRGPDETFQTLFTQPFGPRAIANYMAERAANPPPVYGVSVEDTRRMLLVLSEISRVERNRRITESIGGLGVGALMAGAGIGVLQVDASLSRTEKTQDRVLGGVLLGFGGLSMLGSLGSLGMPSTGERAYQEFLRATESGGDTAQAFAAADKRLQALVAKQRRERVAGGIVGCIAIAGSATGFIWSEFVPAAHGQRMTRRLAWGAGIVAGSLLLGDALLTKTPAEALTKIWRDDPSLNHYRPSVSITSDGAVFSLSGAL